MREMKCAPGVYGQNKLLDRHILTFPRMGLTKIVVFFDVFKPLTAGPSSSYLTTVPTSIRKY